MTTADKIAKAYAPKGESWGPLLQALVNKVRQMPPQAQAEFLTTLEEVSASLQKALEPKWLPKPGHITRDEVNKIEWINVGKVEDNGTRS